MSDNCFHCGASVDYECHEGTVCKCCGERAWPSFMEILRSRQGADSDVLVMETVFELEPGFCVVDRSAQSLLGGAE